MDLPLRARAPAKINLGLFLGGPRADARHELVTVMQSISLADELTLRVASDPDGPDRVCCPGVPGPPAQNLAAAALAAFKVATAWDPPALELSIVKRVPVAAGLGGGSGDAAATLRLAAAAAGIDDEPLLLSLATELGADVPAQVRPGTWLATGAGERLQALPGWEPDFGVLVLPVAAALSTATVYVAADRLAAAGPPARLRTEEELDALHRALRAAPVRDSALPPAELLVNDLEPAARSLCPAIDHALARTRAAGADAAFVSGSGPTVLGLFAGSDGCARAEAASTALAGHNPRPLAATPVDAGFGMPVSNN